MILAYYAIEPIGEASRGNGERREIVARVEFRRAHVHRLGPPNDEALPAHPLFARGLVPYAAQEVRSSSWIREWGRRKTVHPLHRAESLRSWRHCVFTFHDSTFECCAEEYAVTLHAGAPRDVLHGGVADKAVDRADEDRPSG